MALQDGFKVLGLTILNGGTGWGTDQTGTLSMRAPGSVTLNVGTGFTGSWSSNGSGVITGTSIASAGKNYSSGSCAY